MVKVNLSPIVSLSSEQFQQLCFANPEAKLELTAQGELVIMSPTGGESGIRNTELIYQLQAWNKQKKLGVVLGASHFLVKQKYLGRYLHLNKRTEVLTFEGYFFAPTVRQ